MGDAGADLQHLWGDLYGRGAVDDMAALLAEDFVQRDHRPLHQRVGDRDDWVRALRSWLAVADARLRELEVLGVAGGRRACRLLFAGPDEVTGGELEVEVFVVDRVEDGLIQEADVFDDRAAAVACFENGP